MCQAPNSEEKLAVHNPNSVKARLYDARAVQRIGECATSLHCKSCAGWMETALTTPFTT